MELVFLKFLYNKPILVCIPFFSINLEREKRKKFILSARKGFPFSYAKKGLTSSWKVEARAPLIS